MDNKFIRTSEQLVESAHKSVTSDIQHRRVAEAQVYALLALAKEFNNFNSLINEDNGLISAINQIGH